MRCASSSIETIRSSTYDFLDLGQERLGLVIGDIAGKGIAAALLMANLRSQCAIAVERPEQLLRSVNRLFHENTADNSFATLSHGGAATVLGESVR
jgi:serine phosphatase RsbU (regulator of sigma subunit)